MKDPLSLLSLATRGSKEGCEQCTNILLDYDTKVKGEFTDEQIANELKKVNHVLEHLIVTDRETGRSFVLSQILDDEETQSLLKEIYGQTAKGEGA